MVALPPCRAVPRIAQLFVAFRSDATAHSHVADGNAAEDDDRAAEDTPSNARPGAAAAGRWIMPPDGAVHGELQVRARLCCVSFKALCPSQFLERVRS